MAEETIPYGRKTQRPSSAMTLKHTIEEAIYAAAPDITTIEVEGVTPAAPSNGFVQIEKSNGNGFVNCEFPASL